MSATRAGQRVPELDGLRGIAILLVVFLHTVVRPPQEISHHDLLSGWPNWLRNWADLSWCGVDLFFVLSGFLIGGILLDQRGTPRFWRAFYVRRFFRIVPIYAGLLGIAAALGTHGTVPLLAYVVFLQNFWTAAGHQPAEWLGPCWSIAVEEQFYLLAPILIARASSRALLRGLAACIVGALGLRAVLLFCPPFPLSPWDFTLCRVDGLAFGVLGAWLVRSPEARASLVRRRSWLKMLAAALFFATVPLSQLKHAGRIGEGVLLSLGLTVLSILALTLVLMAVLCPEARLSQLLRMRGLQALGKYSYFLYLFHIPVLLAVARVRRVAPGLPYLATVVLAMGVLGVLARLSWRLIEEPLIRMGRSVRTESTAAATLT